MTNLDKYPNLQAILNGTVAGSFRDWITVRPELAKLVVEMDQRVTREKELLKLPSISGPDDWLAEIKRLKERVGELETVLKLVQQWGADARSADSYEVFEAVRLSLIDPAPSREVKVVDCTCIPCICPPTIDGYELCLGCGARTCLAHELAKGGVKT